MKVKTYSDFYCDNDHIFDDGEFELAENTITYLIGCNGAGKTTLADMIKLSAKKEGFTNFEATYNPFANIFKDEETPITKLICHFDKKTTFDQVNGFNDEAAFFESVRGSVCSTGEYVSYRFFDGAESFRQYIIKHPELTDVIMVFDDMDVGVSIDELRIFKQCLNNYFKYLCSQLPTVYFVVTANAYELVKGEKCICVNELDKGYMTFNDYEEYAEEVVASRALKEKRLKREE